MAKIGDSASSQWQDRASYQWTTLLPRRSWAWEILRRDPAYRDAWMACAPRIRTRRHAEGVTVIESDIPAVAAARWGLLAPLENPDRDARDADVFWSAHVCPAVLPVVAVRDGEDDPLGLLPLVTRDCRTIVYVGTDGRQHLLFTRDGRALQLEVRGVSVFAARRLLIDLPPTANSTNVYLHTLRQLFDFIKHGNLREALHPPHPHGRRLAEVVQALDGWRYGAPRRQIAAALIGEERFAQDWPYRRGHLLNRVRRAVERGRGLVNGGYRRFLA